jgi:hypothetical protein
MPGASVVEAFRAQNSIQAHLVCNLLNAAGIRAVIDGESLHSALGDIPMGWATSPRIMVRAEDLAAARVLIEAADNANDDRLADDDSANDDDFLDDDRHPESVPFAPQ